MKRISKIVVCVCALIGTCMHAYAGDPGSSCKDAIPMGKDYCDTVKNGESVWYSAWTFDLPLTVTFAPTNGEGEPAPEVAMDFTCDPGFYDNDILCSLFCPTSDGSGRQFDMPHRPSLLSKKQDGKFYYYLALGAAYRDMLLKFGISQNLEVFVQVTYKCDGVISLSPDNMFSNCVDSAKFMRYGDTVEVTAMDIERHVVVPYVQWQDDTIRYLWKSDEMKPCTLSVANTCDFDPRDQNDGSIIQFLPIEPGDSVTIKATLLYEYVNNKEFPNEAGMYFAKCYSEAPGELKVIKAPQAPPRAKATLMRFDRTYPLNANETAIFAIPISWNIDTMHTQFVSPTKHVLTMAVAVDPDFSEEHTIKSYQFDKAENGRWLGIFGKEMKEWWEKATEQYLYLRFDCTEATTITPSRWRVNPCVANTTNYIHSLDTTFVVKRASTGGNYKLNYAQWVGGDLTMTFTPAKKCSVYVATDCDIAQSFTAENLLYSEKLTSSNNSLTIPADTIASWSERVDEDGYIYMRLHHGESIGTYSMRMESKAPKDVDPDYPASTIVVECKDGKTWVRVSKAQHIVVRDMTGASQDEWDASPEEAHELNLPAGYYILQGEEEKLTIKL